MLMQKDKTNPHFGGKGKVIKLFYKLDTKTPKSIINELKRLINKEIKKTLGRNQQIPSRMSFDSLKELAQKFNFVNDNGRIVALKPKTIIIKNGNENFRESSIIADTIIQTGGVFNGVIKGKFIWGFGGTNKGIHARNTYNHYEKYHPVIKGPIKAGELNAYGAELQNDLIINHDINFYQHAKISNPEGKQVSLFSKKGAFNLNNGSQIGEGVKVSVKSLEVNDGLLNGEIRLRKGPLKMSGNSQIGETGNVYVNGDTTTTDTVIIKGTLSSTKHGLIMSGNSQIGETGKVTTGDSITMKEKSENHGFAFSQKGNYNIQSYSQIGDTGIANAGKNVIAGANAEIRGTLMADKGEVILCGNAKAFKTAVIRNNAIKFHNSARFFGTTYTDNPVFVGPKAVFKPLAQYPLTP